MNYSMWKLARIPFVLKNFKLDENNIISYSEHD